MKQTYEILQWDTDFFGHDVARISSNNLSDKELTECLSTLRPKVKLVYYAAADKIESNQILDEFNGLLVDKKTTFYKDASFDYAESNAYITEYNDNFNLEDLLQLSIDSGVYSRYNIDPNIEEIKYKALYREWMMNSVYNGLADEVLVYINNDTIVGVITLSCKSNRTDIGIVSVKASERGRGIGRSLLKAAEKFSYEKRTAGIQVVTQGTNKPACALYNSFGYKIEKVEYFYHFWL